jgi:CheY-like chemotaxis protein
MEKFEIYRILHVEDDQNFIDLVRIMLNNKLYELDVAHDGSEAVTKAFRNKYDLIIMDIMMPVMDGKIASKTIKSMSPNVPILALTAYDNVDLNEDKQFDYLLRKPITKKILRDKISEILDK